MTTRLTVADFFCGAGGFSEGFYQAGFDIKFCLDNWKLAIKSHDLNHPNCKSVIMNILKIVFDDVNSKNYIDNIVPDTDIIIGSPPCVSFSNSNKSGKADKTLGIQLFEQFLRIVLWKLTKGKCKYWIMENVPNSLKYIKDSYTWDELNLPKLESDNNPSLDIPQKNILVASDYGAPQIRKRGVCGNYIIPKKKKKKLLFVIF